MSSFQIVLIASAPNCADLRHIGPQVSKWICLQIRRCQANKGSNPPRMVGCFFQRLPNIPLSTQSAICKNLIFQIPSTLRKLRLFFFKRRQVFPPAAPVLHCGPRDTAATAPSGRWMRRAGAGGSASASVEGDDRGGWFRWRWWWCGGVVVIPDRKKNETKDLSFI